MSCALLRVLYTTACGHFPPVAYIVLVDFHWLPLLGVFTEVNTLGFFPTRTLCSISGGSKPKSLRHHTFLFVGCVITSIRPAEFFSLALGDALRALHFVHSFGSCCALCCFGFSLVSPGGGLHWSQYTELFLLCLHSSQFWLHKAPNTKTPHHSEKFSHVVGSRRPTHFFFP